MESASHSGISIHNVMIQFSMFKSHVLDSELELLGVCPTDAAHDGSAVPGSKHFPVDVAMQRVFHPELIVSAVDRLKSQPQSLSDHPPRVLGVDLGGLSTEDDVIQVPTQQSFIGQMHIVVTVDSDHGSF